MTIRRNLNLATINDDYGDFLTTTERAPAGTYEGAKMIASFIGNVVDALIKDGRASGLKVCNCDGIREIEVLIFDMLRTQNPDSEIEKAIGLGDALRNADCGEMDKIITELEYARDEAFAAGARQ